MSLFGFTRRGGAAKPKDAQPADFTAEDLARVVARVKDQSDILSLASPDHSGFTEATVDNENGIRVSTMPVDSCPVHMMRATAAMPCASKDFLEYLEVDVRAKWDEHFITGRNIQPSTAPAAPSSSAGSVSARGDATESVIFKYMHFRAPVRLLRDRDFELVSCERWDEKTQTAVLKAISTPAGMVVDSPASEKIVRGSILVSGFVVRPIAVADLPPALRGAPAACEVTYIALVHPRGRLPPAFVNLIIGKQTSTLRTMQQFMRTHPKVRKEQPSSVRSKL